MRRIVVAAVIVGASVGLSSPALGAFQAGAYKGSTSARYAVGFRVSRGQVSGFSYRSRFRCSNRNVFAARGGPYNHIAIRKGRFAATRHNRGRSLWARVTGKLSGRRASGKITRTARFNRAQRLDPRGPILCKSVTTWSAKLT
jgi:hypothetical protein